MASDDIDANIRELCMAERWADAATLWIQERGPEVFTFLDAMRGPAFDTDELFSQFCEDLWRGLPGFRWECSTRTWSYRIARSVWVRALKRSKRRGPAVPLSAAPEVAGAIERVRTSTAAHLRTEVKDRFTALREELSPDDRMLLVLRVDRGLSWDDVARVLTDTGLLDDETKRAIPRLRKRFQRVKARLRQLAAERGLLPAS